MHWHFGWLWGRFKVVYLCKSFHKGWGSDEWQKESWKTCISIKASLTVIPSLDLERFAHDLRMHIIKRGTFGKKSPLLVVSSDNSVSAPSARAAAIVGVVTYCLLLPKDLDSVVVKPPNLESPVLRQSPHYLSHHLIIHIIISIISSSVYSLMKF